MATFRVMVVGLLMMLVSTAWGQSEFGFGENTDLAETTPPGLDPVVVNRQAWRPLLGFGLSMGGEVRDENDEDPYGRGLYLEVDRVWRSNRAIQPTAYAGAVFTAPFSGSCTHPDDSCNVSASTLFGGGKVRLMLPIPFVGPFLEAGVGMSVGRITTMTGRSDDRQDSGLMLHVPVALGLAMGPDHAYTLVFSYLAYPGKSHVDGAMAVGFDIPLR